MKMSIVVAGVKYVLHDVDPNPKDSKLTPCLSDAIMDH